ncbi:hypothetical protein [uncultured Methanocorpusculum sp.]|nr:hypothetical protein [uncultured Methanocorpusculum sp.]
MNTLSKILALLCAAMCLIIPVAAIDEEEISVTAQNPFNGDVHILHVSITTQQELPEHAELSPFFRDDLIEIEETDTVSEDIAAWFRNTEDPTEFDESLQSPDTDGDTTPAGV